MGTLSGLLVARTPQKVATTLLQSLHVHMATMHVCGVLLRIGAACEGRWLLAACGCCGCRSAAGRPLREDAARAALGEWLGGGAHMPPSNIMTVSTPCSPALCGVAWMSP